MTLPAFSASFAPWRDASPSELEDGITPRRRDRKGGAGKVTRGASEGCWFTRGVYQQTVVDGAGGVVGKPGGINNTVERTSGAFGRRLSERD